MPVGALLAAPIAAGLGDLGVAAGTAATIGGIASPIVTGAGLGALTSGISGGNPLTGALTGGIGGGIGEIAGGLFGTGPLGSAFGGTSAPFAGIGGDISSFLGLGGTTASGATVPSGTFGGTAATLGTPVAGSMAGGGAVPSLGTNVNTGGLDLGPGTATGTSSDIGGGNVQLASASNVAPVGGGGSDPTNVTTGAVGNSGGNPYSGGNLTNPSGSINTGSPQVASAWGTMAGSGTGTMGGTTAQPSIANYFKTSNIASGVGNLAASLLAPQIAPSVYAQTNKPLQQSLTGAQGMETMMTAPATSGVLPAGMEQNLDYQRRQARAAVQGQAAATGLSGSTQERDALINENARIQTEKTALEESLLKQAGTYAQIASNDATQLSNLQNSQSNMLSTQMQSAISKFIAAMAPTGNTGTNQNTTYNPATPPSGSGASSGATSAQPSNTAPVAPATAPATPATVAPDASGNTSFASYDYGGGDYSYA